jgi:WD40 repeat protein
VTVSADGNYIAAGESSFRLAQITIWKVVYEERETLAESTASLADTAIGLHLEAKEYLEIKHLKGHKFGVESIQFAPQNNFLISLGDPNDRGLFVWDWEKEKKIS